MDPAFTSDKLAYHEAVDFLYGRINYERTGHASYSSSNYRLDRMRRLLDLLGNPHLQYPVVHVAGTKGKGTTSMVISGLLQGCGLKVGTYTSPHLLRLEERMRCQGKSCTPDELVNLVNRTRQAAQTLEDEGAGRPTFFELTTAMGMMHFADRDCDIVVLEVGLGGRLDSTNVCQPTVCVITSISLDHQAQLGDTIPQIAAEKAGIIKPRIPVVCSARDPQARQVIAQHAQSHQADLSLIDRDFQAEWTPLTPNGSKGQINMHPGARSFARLDYRTSRTNSIVGQSAWELPFLGPHQADNVAAALTAIDVLAERSSSRADCLRSPLASLGVGLVEQLQASLPTVRVPARLQPCGYQPLRIIDTAHNPASIQAAVDALDVHFPQAERTFVFASSRDKDYRQMVAILLGHCQRLIVTAYHNNPRGLPLNELLQVARACPSAGKSPPAEILQAEDSKTAWELAEQVTSRDGLICATGSFFLAAELLPLVGADPD